MFNASIWSNDQMIIIIIIMPEWHTGLQWSDVGMMQNQFSFNSFNNCIFWGGFWLNFRICILPGPVKNEQKPHPFCTWRARRGGCHQWLVYKQSSWSLFHVKNWNGDQYDVTGQCNTITFTKNVAIFKFHFDPIRNAKKLWSPHLH